jgi:hypothetical protein
VEVEAAALAEMVAAEVLLQEVRADQEQHFQFQPLRSLTLQVVLDNQAQDQPEQTEKVTEVTDKEQETQE